MSRLKIGFLMSGSGGNPSGIGNYVYTLDAAGIPSVTLCNDGDVGIGDALNRIYNGSSVDHRMVFRTTGFDVPNYAIDAATAAANHFNLLRSRVPANVYANRDRVWICVLNEVDKNRSEWLADFAAASVPLWTAAGFKIVLFNWSTGEPEPEHWRAPKMVSFLRSIQNRSDVAIGLHEYALSNDIWFLYPYRVGRFMDLFAACDENGIQRPNVWITEWGWHSTSIPEPQIAIEQIRGVGELYANYPEIIGAGMWYLGSGYGGIADLANRLIVPVTNLSISWDYDPPVEPPTSETFEQWASRRVEEMRTITLNRDALLQKDAVVAGFNPFESEFWDWFDGVQYALQGFRDLHSERKRVYWVPVPADGNWPSNANSFDYPIDDDPLAGLVVGAPFAVPFVKTSSFNDPRSYGNGLHEGIDFDIIGGVFPDSKESVYAGIDGTIVEPVPNLAGYGIHRVIEGQHNGKTIRLFYCHMDAAFVNIGDSVSRGDPMGELGSTGRSEFEHVHITLTVPGHGLAGYVVPDVVDPEQYVDSTPVAPENGSVDMSKYFRVPEIPQYWRGDQYAGDIVILKNNWGAGDERQQLQGIGRDWFVTKNQQWERRDVGPDFIDLKMDTSPGNNEFYTVAGHWLPRLMDVGDIFTRNETVQYYAKSDCSPGSSTQWSTAIKLAQHYDQYSPTTGVIFDNVVCLEWLINNNVEERYYFAASVGLIEWQKPAAGFRSYAAERISVGQQSDNVRESIPCWTG